VTLSGVSASGSNGVALLVGVGDDGLPVTVGVDEPPAPAPARRGRARPASSFAADGVGVVRRGALLLSGVLSKRRAAGGRGERVATRRRPSSILTTEDVGVGRREGGDGLRMRTGSAPARVCAGLRMRTGSAPARVCAGRALPPLTTHELATGHKKQKTPLHHRLYGPPRTAGAV
jgi:hypothetical protein